MLTRAYPRKILRPACLLCLLALLFACRPWIPASAATVRTRLRRARNKLHDLLGGDDHEEERLSEFDGAYPAPRRAE